MSIVCRPCGVVWLVCVCATLLAGCGASSTNLPPTSAAIEHCQVAISQAALACDLSAIERQHDCVLADGAACLDSDEPAKTSLTDTIITACPDAATLQAAGFGPMAMPQALAESLAVSCGDAAHRLVSRSFGGPQARLLDSGAADAQTTTCLTEAYRQSGLTFAAVYADFASCAFDSGCAVDLEARRAETVSSAEAAIDAACPAGGLESVLGSSSTVHLARAADQAECAVAEAHPQSDHLPLRCGPSNRRLAGISVRDIDGHSVDTALDQLPRGEPFQLVLDEATWGTVCGDGSPYAIWLRLAPDDAPVDSLLIHLEGAGACAVGTCANTDPAKFQALGDHPNESFGGYMRARPDNPFADRSLLYLPSCNQDLFVGGGVEDPGPGPSGASPIYRFGGVNLRASLQILRDIIWQRVVVNDPAGYHPDQWDVFFSGTSSGGYGVQYNLHYVLDELRWRNTIAHAHAAVVQGGGLVPNFDTFFSLIGETWGQQPYLPPYCFDTSCAMTDVMVPRHLERLLEVDRQRLLISSAQHDDTQARTQGFIVGAGGVTVLDNRDQWINGLRDVYCRFQGHPALHSFFPANLGAGIHGFINKDEFYDSALTETEQALADGVHIFDWMNGIVNVDIDNATDRVEEGALTMERPRVQAFNCDVAD